jgi:uncharacterized protein (DUF1800 family)
MARGNFEVHFSLKIGLGTDSSHALLQSKSDALGQYSNKSKDVGVRSIRSMKPEIEAWPAEKLFTLDERIKAVRYARKEYDRLDSSKDIPREELDKLKRNLKRGNIKYVDQLHLAHQSIYGQNPARQRLIHFWINHFTIGGGEKPSNFTIGDVIQNVIGNGIDGYFSDLAYNVTRHPAMLTYLDNVYSVGERSERGRKAGRKGQIGLNDNLAREVMELYTTSPSIGYNENDIREAAKILSGWGDIFDNPNTIQNFKRARIKDFHEAYFKDKAEPGKKIVLGREYPDGKGALRLWIDDLADSDHSARFLTRKLCIHFIADNPTEEDLAYVLSAWLDSKGHLPTVHQALLERVVLSTQSKIQWPITWLFTVLRSSQANLVQGFDELHTEILEMRGEYRIMTLLEEIGQDFWSRRQPDGYSISGSDWISPEHFERRMRLAAMIHDHGRPARKADELMDLFDVSNSTRELVDKGKTSRQRFVLLACCRELMGA